MTTQSRSEGFLTFRLTPVREPSFIPQIMLPVEQMIAKSRHRAPKCVYLRFRHICSRSSGSPTASGVSSPSSVQLCG
nr:MAG TPA: hypothetical protein [Caudoviricetes sp.]